MRGYSITNRVKRIGIYGLLFENRIYNPLNNEFSLYLSSFRYKSGQSVRKTFSRYNPDTVKTYTFSKKSINDSNKISKENKNNQNQNLIEKYMKNKDFVGRENPVTEMLHNIEASSMVAETGTLPSINKIRYKDRTKDKDYFLSVKSHLIGRKMDVRNIVKNVFRPGTSSVYHDSAVVELDGKDLNSFENLTGEIDNDNNNNIFKNNLMNNNNINENKIENRNENHKAIEISRKRFENSQLLNPKASYILLYSYGGLVMMNILEQYHSKIIKSLLKYVEEPLELVNIRPTESYGIVVRPSLSVPSIIHSDYLIIQSLDINSIQLIGGILSQTVGLQFYERKADELMDIFASMNDMVAKNGKLPFSKRKELFQVLARSHSLLTEVLSRLKIFGASEITWNQPHLSDLHSSLKNDFELKERYMNLDQKVELIRSHAMFMAEMLNSTKSNSLEVTIIVLISIEIGVMVFDISRSFS